MRPSTFHSPGLDAATNALIGRILDGWKKIDTGTKTSKAKKRK